MLQKRMSSSTAGPRISLAAATAIVVASMVGTGVFTSLGFQIKDIPSGFPILVLWAVGGLVSLCGAFCYAELGAMMPRSGGEYHLLAQAYHPLVGFLAGWVSVTAGFAAPIAAAAMLFGNYAHGLWPVLPETGSAFGLVLVVMLVQLCHIRFIERFQLGFTVMKVLLILAFVLGAVFLGQGNWALLKPRSGDSALYLQSSYAIALVYVMYAYTGWNAASYVAGDITEPKRNLPRALVFGTLGVMVLYLALNAVFLVGAPWEAMSGQPQVALIAARAIFGGPGGSVMGAMIALGLVAHVSAMMFAGTRVLKVIGQDSLILRWLEKPNPHGAPWPAVVFITSLVLLLMFTGTFEQLLLYIQGLLFLSSLLCVLAVPWLRWRKPETPRPFKMPLHPLPPLIFAGVTGWMLWSLVSQRPIECLWGAVTLVAGVVLYFMKPKTPAA
jgi:basic amino acid/polyamine antiporter, APA family